MLVNERQKDKIVATSAAGREQVPAPGGHRDTDSKIGRDMFNAGRWKEDGSRQKDGRPVDCGQTCRQAAGKQAAVGNRRQAKF
jgi:hypothetical protein